MMQRSDSGEQGSPIEFWFDFISPFGYLASLRVDELAAKQGRTVLWRPILLGVTVLRIMGLKPIPQTPLKAEYALKEIDRYQRRHGHSIGRDLARPPMAPVPAARAFVALQHLAPVHATSFARAVLHTYWQEGIDMDTAELLQAVGVAAGVPEGVLAEALSTPQAAGWLRASVEEAVARGVFGSPFFMVDGEPFFGVDKLELIEEWLATGGW